YEDVLGFCKSATTADIGGHNYVLTPGRYVGAADVEEDEMLFEDRILSLTTKLEEQFDESIRLSELIRANLKGISFNG
ncbi:MAG: SAM-dependent methyltransferase, partial [Acidobacteriota bacterium]|nr:SAM-dependent methyltransferase [Acidobacteriota bacterium]